MWEKNGLNLKMETKVQRVGKEKKKKTDGSCLIPTVVYKVLRKRMFCFSTKILKRYIVKKKKKSDC